MVLLSLLVVLVLLVTYIPKIRLSNSSIYEQSPTVKTHYQTDSKEWNPNHGQSSTVKVTDPNNYMPAKFNTKYNAKFNAKSSAMFAVKSNAWLKFELCPRR
ncbi:hypothetical protein CLU79DRAFT_721634 [Phycomyces nitens]|nr:hypothetical protein CLU79DRAFT_721634 [Phycomyces nitens]